MDYLLEAFRQSYFALGNSDPNPPVGAVLVSENGIIIGRGYTQLYGGPHAEVMAINEALDIAGEDALKKSTLFVTLEPCSHYGKTPPCTNLILEKKIGKVVIANYDKSEKVKGVDILRENNVEIVIEPENKYATESMWTTDAFHFNLKFNRPRVWLKWAQTNDGYLGPKEGPSGNISGPAFREFVYRIRKLIHGILVTPGTIKTDFPLLNPRFGSMSLKNYFGNGVLSDLVLSDLMNIFENNYPENFKNIQKRFLLLPNIYEAEWEKYSGYLKKQNELGGNAYFLYSNKIDLKQHPFIKQSETAIDYENIEEIVKFTGYKGCQNLLVEAGAVYADKFLKSNLVDFIIAAKSKSNIWSEGKFFSLSKALSTGNLSEFHKNSFEKIYEFELDSDIVYFFKKKI